MGQRDFSLGDDGIRIESIVNKILSTVFENCGYDLFLLSEKNKITNQFEEAISLIAIKTLYAYGLHLSHCKKSDCDFQDEEEILLRDMINRVFNEFKDVLFILSEADQISTEYEERVCLIALTVLSAYYAYTSEVDKELGIPCEMNYLEHKLPCGNKLHQCQESCDSKVNILCWKNKKSVKRNQPVKKIKD